MKKLLTTFLISFFVFLPLSFSFAQESENETSDDIEIQILEDEEAQEESQEQETEQKPLAETLETEETQEDQIQPPGRDYWTILGAILIPSVFIIVCYFILKAFET
jgi:hypothetical protein